MLLKKSSRQKNQKGAKFVEVNYLKTVFFLREQETGIYLENMLTSMLMSETFSLDDKSLKKSITEYNMFNIDLFVEREECNSKITKSTSFFYQRRFT